MLDQANVFGHEYGGWIIGGLFLTICWVVGQRNKYKYLQSLPTMRDITMTEEGRRMYIQRVSFECICDGLLEAVINGQITDDEANVEMAKLAKLYKQEDLIPLIRKKKTPMLKAQLKNNKRMRALNGGRTDKIPIPEPAPTTTSSEELSLASILKE